MELSLEWAVGIIVSAFFGVMGWIWRLRATDRVEILGIIADLDNRVDAHDERMRQGITYVEADRLIDLKLEPLRTELRSNTEAVKDLTQELRRQREG